MKKQLAGCWSTTITVTRRYRDPIRHCFVMVEYSVSIPKWRGLEQEQRVK